MVGAIRSACASPAARVHRAIFRPGGRALPAAAFLLAVWGVTPAAGQGRLGELRDGVRLPPPPSSSSGGSSAPRAEPDWHHDDHDHHHHHHHWDDEATGDLYAFAGLVMLAGVTSPFWAPHGLIDEGFDAEYLFPRFPYDHGPGYMQLEPYLRHPRRWSARLRTEYADNLDDMTRIGGHLLLTGSSRWGLDTQMDYLKEDFADRTYDEIYSGDCNLVFRFAQSQNMQWRTGVGFNWLDDPLRTDFGFNFTYGMDYFPRRPWVISSTLDWGTLGRSELFRFRTTAGLIVHGVEAYTGYEYLDVDETQIGSLMAGARIWF